jgi:hypothetical protein
MVPITLETYGPNEEQRYLRPEQLEETYRGLSPDEGAMFVWNDGGQDGVLLVGVGEDFAYAELLYGGTFYRFQAFDEEGTRAVLIGGCGPEEYPKCYLMPREQGLELLRQAADIDALFAGHRWVV